ncbi:alpha/beta hydrolase [Actinoallomurus vinaceus]|uniref:Alpha/beta hydrolase n=1 Tax=Actinoallomurus vinaceus TaxID=1080074 RepID=A0ABP8UGR8_9ACTN
MTEFVDVDGGRIAYDVIGEGPLVVMQHGMGDMRQAFRHLAPQLAAAGYRVVTADMRGHGESSMDWGSDAISRTDVAGDLLALIRHLGGPAVIVGHSLGGGAATIAAATASELVTAIVEINPFTRVPKTDVGALFTNSLYRRGGLRLISAGMFKSLKLWMSYLNVAYPTKPADYDAYMAQLAAKLSEPGRFAEFMKTTKSTPADAQAQLPNVHVPALILMGAAECDFPDPRAEGEAIVSMMPTGIGTLGLIEGAGHYPHAQSADLTAAQIIPFLKEHAGA